MALSTDEVVLTYREHGYTKTAALLGVTTQAVAYHLKKAGVTGSRKTRPALELLEAVEELLEFGEGRDQIVQRLGFASDKSLDRRLRALERPDLARKVWTA